MPAMRIIFPIKKHRIEKLLHRVLVVSRLQVFGNGHRLIQFHFPTRRNESVHYLGFKDPHGAR